MYRALCALTWVAVLSFTAASYSIGLFLAGVLPHGIVKYSIALSSVSALACLPLWWQAYQTERKRHGQQSQTARPTSAVTRGSTQPW